MASLADVNAEIARRELARRAASSSTDTSGSSADDAASAGFAGFKRGALSMAGLDPGDIDGAVAALAHPHAPKLGDLPSPLSVLLSPLLPMTQIDVVKEGARSLNPEAFDKAAAKEEGDTRSNEERAPTAATIGQYAPQVAAAADFVANVGPGAARSIAAKADALRGGASGAIRNAAEHGVYKSVRKSALNQLADILAPKPQVVVPAPTPKAPSMPADVMVGDVGDPAAPERTGAGAAPVYQPEGIGTPTGKKIGVEQADAFDPGGQDWRAWQAASSPKGIGTSAGKKIGADLAPTEHPEDFAVDKPALKAKLAELLDLEHVAPAAESPAMSDQDIAAAQAKVPVEHFDAVAEGDMSPRQANAIAERAARASTAPKSGEDVKNAVRSLLEREPNLARKPDVVAKRLGIKVAVAKRELQNAAWGF